jgi:hypothetical protein
MADQKMYQPASRQAPTLQKPSPFAPRPFAAAKKREAPRVSPLPAGEPVQLMMEGEDDTPPPIPARSELELLLDENFLPVAIQGEAPDAVVLKLRGWTADAWTDDKIFYAEGSADESPIHPLPASKINAHWDAKYPSPFARVSGPDWRANCADYAIGQAFDDVGAAKTYLASSYTNKGNYSSVEQLTEIFTGLDAGVYVTQVGLGFPHFIRLTVGATDVHLSQKDQESGVYEATLTKGQAATYIVDKSSSGIIYQKP